MKKTLCIILAALFALLIVGSFFGGSDSSSSYSGSKSSSYGKGKQYDDDVDYVAKQFGKSSDEVNNVYNALAKEIY